jgi:hypothetical protein
MMMMMMMMMMTTMTEGDELAQGDNVMGDEQWLTMLLVSARWRRGDGVSLSC